MRTGASLTRPRFWANEPNSTDARLWRGRSATNITCPVEESGTGRRRQKFIDENGGGPGVRLQKRQQRKG
jgi:hypothetical protein